MIILWYKAFHVFFMVAWFAGIFYLPRLFVYHAENEAASDPEDKIRNDSKEQADISQKTIPAESIFHTSETLKVMERRLLYFVTPFAIFTLIFGLLLIHSYGMDWFRMSHWLHAKLLLVAFLYIYHGYCFVLLKRFKDNKNDKSARFFRIFNEVPVLILLAIIILAIVKPF
ncbi:CopD family protein [Psychrosphaera haliotis]|uniref:Protoporphyrinogen IX oxidase n=1 Tax=Psychrosphaera haliotis TaxID=555083 RepID=A0A6N8F973_9GAMM|nr:CopD family protein [Psychrosphaera haliotis]MUH73145.1 TIGR00701 family protein [Psychrosphaera haliotis]